jgi:enoyl-[acyl-carrier-protein] reductase (NADH)
MQAIYKKNKIRVNSIKAGVVKWLIHKTIAGFNHLP